MTTTPQDAAWSASMAQALQAATTADRIRRETNRQAVLTLRAAFIRRDWKTAKTTLDTVDTLAALTTTQVATIRDAIQRPGTPKARTEALAILKGRTQ